MSRAPCCCSSSIAVAAAASVSWAVWCVCSAGTHANVGANHVCPAPCLPSDHQSGRDGGGMRTAAAGLRRRIASRHGTTAQRQRPAALDYIRRWPCLWPGHSAALMQTATSCRDACLHHKQPRRQQEQEQEQEHLCSASIAGRAGSRQRQHVARPLLPRCARAYGCTTFCCVHTFMSAGAVACKHPSARSSVGADGLPPLPPPPPRQQRVVAAAEVHAPV